MVATRGLTVNFLLQNITRMIIEKVECTSTLKYYIRLLPKLGLQVHFNTMCFLLSTVEGIEVHVSKSKKKKGVSEK